MNAGRLLAGVRRLLVMSVVTYLGIGLISATWAVTMWGKGAVEQPVLVFLRNMLYWPFWVIPLVTMGMGGNGD